MVAMADLRAALWRRLGAASPRPVVPTFLGAPHSFQLVKTRVSRAVPSRESWHRTGTNPVRIGSGGNPPLIPYERVGPRRRGRLEATPLGCFAALTRPRQRGGGFTAPMPKSRHWPIRPIAAKPRCVGKGPVQGEVRRPCLLERVSSNSPPVSILESPK